MNDLMRKMLKAYVGLSGFMSIHDFRVKVVILEARRAYGRTDLLVKGEHDTAARWVSSGKVEIK